MTAHTGVLERPRRLPCGTADSKGAAGTTQCQPVSGESDESLPVTPAAPDLSRTAKWVRYVRVCVRCSQPRPHAGHGLCSTCFTRRWVYQQPVPTDYDEAVVLRAMDGERLPLTRADRLEAVRRLEARRLSHRGIARQLGIHPRQVCRDLTGLRGEAGAA